MTINKEQAVSDAMREDRLLLAERYKGTDIVKALLDHKEHALKGTYPGVQSPHYSIAGMFEWAAAEIERLRAASRPLEQQQAVSGDVVEPFTWAYRYPAFPPKGATVIRFGTGGREINGAKPIEAIPLYAHAALTASGMGSGGA